jgi:hypothetical protein
MPIAQSELKIYTATTVNDTGSNGGRMSSNLVTDNLKNNVWPDIPLSERTAGSIKYRKLFWKVENATNLPFQQAELFVETYTPAGDNVTIFAATFEDLQSAISSPRLYGAGQLNANVAAAATAITVATEGAALAVFAPGDKIRIADKSDINDNVNKEEYATIATSGVIYSGDVATLTLTGGLTNGYSAANTRVSSVYAAGTIAGTVINWVKISASGTYDTTLHPVEVDSIGGVSQSWTITFTSSTAFTVTGDTIGSVGSGTTAGDFSPNNATFTKPYFILRASGFGGTWATNNTITFTTHPAALPFWERREVPAGAAAYSNNKIIVAIKGESA